MELQNLPKGAAVLGEGHGAQAGEGIGGGSWDPVQDCGGRLVRSSQRPRVPGEDRGVGGGVEASPGMWAAEGKQGLGVGVHSP